MLGRADNDLPDQRDNKRFALLVELRVITCWGVT